MKMTKTLVTGITAAVALTLCANAEDGAKKGKRAEGKGKPDKEAMEQRRAEMKAKMLKRFDADTDGKLSEDERKTARETIGKERKEIHAAVLKEFDKDTDGKLSEDERKGVKEWVETNYPDAIHMGPPRGDKKGKGGPGADRKGKGKGAPAPGKKGKKGKKNKGADAAN